MLIYKLASSVLVFQVSVIEKNIIFFAYWNTAWLFKSPLTLRRRTEQA